MTPPFYGSDCTRWDILKLMCVHLDSSYTLSSLIAEKEIDCTCEDVMAFFSAANRIPPLGFDKHPTLAFNHTGDTILMTASTCDLQLQLPTIHGSVYEDFKEALLLSIKGNDGFGGVQVLEQAK